MLVLPIPSDSVRVRLHRHSGDFPLPHLMFLRAPVCSVPKFSLMSLSALLVPSALRSPCPSVVLRTAPSCHQDRGPAGWLPPGLLGAHLCAPRGGRKG